MCFACPSHGVYQPVHVLAADVCITFARPYVLIEQDIAEIVVQRRSEAWRSSYYYPGSTVTLESIGLTIAVEAVYERVENADMRAFRAENRE